VNRDFVPLLNGFFPLPLYFRIFYFFFYKSRGLFKQVNSDFFSYWFLITGKAQNSRPFYYYIPNCVFMNLPCVFALIGIWYLVRKKDRITPVIFYNSLILIYLYAFAQESFLSLHRIYLFPACAVCFFYVLWGIFV
jgi:hypothetical protein